MAVVERVARALGIDHAGSDVAVVGSHCYILEFNILFGYEALNATGVRLGPLILDYLLRQMQPTRSPDGHRRSCPEWCDGWPRDLGRAGQSIMSNMAPRTR